MPDNVFDAVRLVPVTEVAQHLGLAVSKRGKPAMQCPACKATHRHTKHADHRLACVIVAGGLGWWCVQCDAKGTSVCAFAYMLAGGPFRELKSSEDRRRVAVAIEAYVGTPAASVARRSEPPPPAPPRYPPASEVGPLWRAAGTAIEDQQVRRYLATRGIRAGVVTAHDLARALPEAPSYQWMTHCPAGTYASWWETDHRLLVPLYDFIGNGRSVLARLIRKPVGMERKSTPPSGYERRGLVMANAPMRAVLAGGPTCDVITIREGEIDYLETATQSPGEAVLGIFSGSFTAELGARIPHGTLVRCQTDDDEQGDKYAEQIRTRLPNGVGYERVR